MGEIPDVDHMVSTVFLNPKNGDVLPEQTTFTIQLNACKHEPWILHQRDSTYYTAPQIVGGNKNIIGHTHVTVQDTVTR